MEDLLTVAITHYNASDFVLNTLYCLEKITKNSYKVIIRDNNSNIKEFLNLKKKIQKYPNVDLYRVENFEAYPSMAHGISCNDLISKINTKYGVLMDSDFTFLHKDWDEILINEINVEYPIIGTQIDPKTESNKALDFPNMVGMLFDTEILKKLKIDFRPNNDDPEHFKDTGYQLPEKYLKNGYKGKLLWNRVTLAYKLGPFHKLIVEEFYLDRYDKIFATHFGRGTVIGLPKYKRKRNKAGRKGHIKIQYIIPIIGHFLLNLKCKREKEKWINICKKIVDDL